MARHFAFSLVCPESELASGEAVQVIAPGTEGEFGVLANHAPFMTALKTGMVRILGGDSGTEQRFWVRGGFAQVSADGLIILTGEAVDLAKTEPKWVADALEKARAGDTPSSQERLQWLEGLQDYLPGTRH